MLILRKEHRIKPIYSQIAYSLIEDTRLSWRAKGLYTYIWSRPDGWELNFTDLQRRSTDGETSIRSALKELQLAGYYRTEPIRGEKGHLMGRRMVVYDMSNSAKTTEHVGNHSSVKPRSGQTASSKTNDTSYHSNTHCGGRGSLRSPKVPSTDGFFGNGDEEDPFISKAITKLENHIRQERKINGRRINRKKWYNELRLLLQDIEGDKRRLKTVLLQFINSQVTKFKPMVECAASFRSKFLKIESWVNQYAPPPPKDQIIVEIGRHYTVG